MFAVVLVLIAVIAAIILFLVMARGYCECRSWPDWWAGEICPLGCNPRADETPAGWNQDALLYCRKQLGSYGTSEVNELPGASQIPSVHERYFFYQSPSSTEVYFFLAAQASGYDASYGSVQGSALTLDVIRVDPTHPYSQIPVSCSGPRIISEGAPSSVGGGGSERTWGWYCRVSGPQGGYGSTVGGLSGYRVFIKNSSLQSLRYCYVAVCDRKFPQNTACKDPVNELQIQGAPAGRGGYPSTPGGSYTPPYPSTPGASSPPPTGGQ